MSSTWRKHGRIGPARRSLGNLPAVDNHRERLRALPCPRRAWVYPRRQFPESRECRTSPPCRRPTRSPRKQFWWKPRSAPVANRVARPGEEADQAAISPQLPCHQSSRTSTASDRVSARDPSAEGWRATGRSARRWRDERADTEGAEADPYGDGEPELRASPRPGRARCEYPPG